MSNFPQYIYYWEHRTTLSSNDWSAFYQMTHRYLSSCSLGSFETELGNRKSLIDDFFHDKIFARAGSESGTPLGPGAICLYIHRYLKGRLRGAWEKKRVTVDDEDHPEDSYEHCGCEKSPDTDEILKLIGLAVGDVAESARGFLATQDEAERMYLALHACADEAEALSNLAKRFRVPSYHYKAKKLGITREKGDCEAGYENTAIGRWLNQALKIPLTDEYRQEILAALKILCLVSLSEWEGTTP